MVLNNLLNKDVRITFITETSDLIGQLREIDNETHSVHVHVYNSRIDYIVPLFTVKSIREHY